MANNIKISEHEAALIKDILSQKLPADCKVWAFGKRTTGESRRLSDLDIAIESKGLTKIDPNFIAELKEEFKDSALEWMVDVYDYNAVSEEKREEIDQERIRLF